MFIYEVLPDGEVFSYQTYIEGSDPPITMRGGQFIVSEEKHGPGEVLYKDGAFVPKQVDLLKNLKELKWREIKDKRDEAEFSPFTYNGMVFDGDADAQRRMMVYISVSKTALASGENFSREFTLADNTVVTLDANDFVGMELAKANQVADVFAKAVALRNRIEQSTTPEQVSAVVWD